MNTAQGQGIVVKHLTHSYGSHQVLDDLSFEVNSGDIHCLLGNSGSGKSTLLRTIAGLENPSNGSISIDGRVVFDATNNIPAEQRSVGIVFQDYALFPHLNIYRNIAFGIGNKPVREKQDIAAAGLKGSLDGKHVVVQGLGNVGYHAAKFLKDEDGAVIVAIIERDGGIYNKAGLDVESVKSWITTNGGVSGFPEAEFYQNGNSLLEAECDILIPAALEGVINLENAARIKASILIEAANGPVTAGADEILRENGCVIIPDMYANAGGVTVSYFEWVKNLSHIRFGRMQRRQEEARQKMVINELERLSRILEGKWEMSEDFKQNYIKGADELQLVRSGLDDTMRGALKSMRELWHGRGDVTDLRTAAYLVSIEKISASYMSKFTL